MKAFLSVLVVIILVLAWHKAWAQVVGSVSTDAQCQTASVSEVGNIVFNDTADGYSQILQQANADLIQKNQTIQAIEVGIADDQVKIATSSMALTALTNCMSALNPAPVSQPIYGNQT